MTRLFSPLVTLAVATAANAYWLMGIENILTTERIDPIVNPNAVSAHVHSVVGGSNFRLQQTTASLRESECTSIPIAEDHSNYWVPLLYYQHKNGSFTSLSGGMVIYYLFDAKGNITAFPDDFRMISGTPSLRTYDESSFAQQAVTFLCLDFNGQTTRHSELPKKHCPSGIRSQINFPMCWNGKDVDSADHKSHVAFPSGGPDSGSCKDPNFPVTLPRIFMEYYWATGDLYNSGDAMDNEQPFVFSNGDPTGYGYHGDFFNGWKAGVLQKAVANDGCTCNDYGDFTCCANKGIFTKKPEGSQCHITKQLDEQTTGTLSTLPGNNPVTRDNGAAADTMNFIGNDPARIQPVYAYTGASPDKTGSVVPGSGNSSSGSSSSSSASAASGTGSASSSSATAQSASSSVAASATSSSVQAGITPTSEPALPSQILIATSSAGSSSVSSSAVSAPSASASSGSGHNSSHPHHNHHHQYNHSHDFHQNTDSSCKSNKSKKRSSSVRQAKRFHQSNRRRFGIEH